MKDRGRESFRPNIVYKTKQRLQLAWQTPRSIEEQVRRGLFADHNLFAVSVFFFSIPQCNCWSGPMKLRNKFWNCGPTVKGQPTTWTWCRRQRFMFAKLPRWLSAGQEKLDAKSQQWNPWSKVDNLRRKGKDLIPNRNFSTMRMIRHRTFPSKDESTNGGRGHQTTKNAKKSRRNGVNAGPSSALTKVRLTPRFANFFTLSWKFGKTQPRQSKLDVVWLGPNARQRSETLTFVNFLCLGLTFCWSFALQNWLSRIFFMTTNITLRFLSSVVGERRSRWSTSELIFVFFRPLKRVSKAMSRRWFLQFVDVEFSGRTQAKSRTTSCPSCHFHRQFEAFAIDSQHKAVMQVPASRDRRPQSWNYSDPPTHPVCLCADPSALPIHASIPTLRQRFSTNCLSARREDLAFNESQACHAKIQGLFKDLLDFCIFQGLFKTLKTPLEIQVLFKVRTHPVLGRPARLPFFIRVTYSILWRAHATVLEIILFWKSRIRRTFLKVCLHDATARRSAPVDSTVHAPRLVQCQKIATLLGLASSRRATDWLWVETDTDACAIFLLLWT